MEKNDLKNGDTAPGIRNTRGQSSGGGQNSQDELLEGDESDLTPDVEDVDEESNLVGDENELEDDDSIDSTNDAGEAEEGDEEDELSGEAEDAEDEDFEGDNDRQ